MSSGLLSADMAVPAVEVRCCYHLRNRDEVKLDVYFFHKWYIDVKNIEDEETIPPLFHEIFNLENQKWYSYF